jgi:hypothetical protein
VNYQEREEEYFFALFFLFAGPNLDFAHLGRARGGQSRANTRAGKKPNQTKQE